MVTTLYVDGMRSVHCVRAVFSALAGVPGVARADVTLGRVVVEHDGAVTEAALTEAVEPLGYTIREVVTERRRLIIQDTPAPDASP